MDARDKQLALVTAAVEAFRREGFSASRIGDIATAAGVGKGTVYEYFSSKEELLLAACLYCCAQQGLRSRQAMAEVDPELVALLPGHGPLDGPVRLPPLPDALAALRIALHTATRVILEAGAGDSRLFLELVSVAGAQPDLRERVTTALAAVLQTWEELLHAFLEVAASAGAIRRHPDLRGLCRLYLASVDGLVLQRSWVATDTPAEAAHRHVEAFLHTLITTPTE
jgi:TetR/AcrR family fatty acid metabolism transcriptional regulator